MTLLAHRDLAARVAQIASTLRIDPGTLVPLAVGLAPGVARRPGSTRHPEPTSPTELIPLPEPTSPTELIATALAVRASGGVPLVGDDRWSPEHWARVRRSIADAGARSDAGWATLTSGSTGAPRIVLRTAASWSDSFDAVGGLLGLTAGDALLLTSPAASSLSLFSIAHAFAAGVDLVLPRAHAVAADDLAEATLVHGTPRSLRSIVDAIEGGADHRIRAALIGGSDLDASLRARAEALGIRVVAYYGAAELSFVAVDSGDGLRPFPGVEVDLRDGELWVRSAFVASGYLAGGGPRHQDPEGWVTVGDRAEWTDTASPALLLRGRDDDAILTAAATVVPADVEAALRGLEGVTDAVVFGMPNPGVGALVSAVIEVDPASTRPTVAAIRSQVAAHLLPPQVPRLWFGVTELPRTLSGKPARAEIVRRAVAGEVTRLD